MQKYKSVEDLVYKNRYEIYFIYDDGEIDIINTRNVNINIGEEKKLSVGIFEYYDTDYNFDDISNIIIDIFEATGEIKSRKVLKVKFDSFNLEYNTTKHEASILNVDFGILDFEIQQEGSIKAIKVIKRGIKIGKFID